MILECNNCEAFVEAQELHSYLDNDQEGPPGQWTLAKCPRCSMPMLAVQVDYGDGFDPPSRVFPPKSRELGYAVPEPIRIAFSEAQVCFRAKAFTASAIMCRKTLEGLCSEHNIRERSLSASLRKLKENGTIEARLFEWAEALRTLGNEAAHGVNSAITAQEAKDIIEFTEALAEYVFTYRDKFERFQKRRAKRGQSEESNDE
jgi:hypothetical protein